MKHLKEYQSYQEDMEMDHSHEMENYMFFGNLQTIKREIESILALDPQKVDRILKDGHGWATDHIATSTDDIQEVANFLKNSVEHHEEMGEPEELALVTNIEGQIDESYEPNYKEIADQLHKSMSGLGTDFDMFSSAIEQIENGQQYDKLLIAFGKRDGQDLENWISNDFFGGWEWTKYIQPFYRKIGRPTPAGIQSWIDKHGK